MVLQVVIVPECLMGPADRPVVDVYVAFLCPQCATFHDAQGSDLQQVAEDGETTLRLRSLFSRPGVAVCTLGPGMKPSNSPATRRGGLTIDRTDPASDSEGWHRLLAERRGQLELWCTVVEDAATLVAQESVVRHSLPG